MPQKTEREPAPDPDPTTAPVPARSIPDFTPVPRERMRRGGWSADRQRQFIELLAETGSVRSACRRMGVGEHHIYKLRRHPEAESFRTAWEAALDIGIARIEDVAMDRALNGVEMPVYHGGEIVGTRRAYNDRLLMFMLKTRAPGRFGGGEHGAAMDPARLGREKARMRKQLRAEWEAEREATAPTPSEIRASLETKITGLRREVEARQARQWETLSDETRAAWEHFEELRNRDLARLHAQEEKRRAANKAPRQQINAAPQPKKALPAPKPPKTWHRLTDEGWD